MLKGGTNKSGMLGKQTKILQCFQRKGLLIFVHKTNCVGISFKKSIKSNVNFLFNLMRVLICFSCALLTKTKIAVKGMQTK